jgi:hypothetical protein
MLQRLMSNPAQILMSRGFQVPQGITDPNQIIQHLLNTGQVSQAQVNNAMNMRNNPILQNIMKY